MVDENEYRFRNIEEAAKRIERKLNDFDKTFVRLERYLIAERLLFGLVSVVLLSVVGLWWKSISG